MANVCASLKKAYIPMAGGVAAAEIKEYSITTDGATTSGIIDGINNLVESLILVLEVSSYTDGSYVAKLQHSPNGIDWVDVASGATPAVAAAGFNFIAIGTDVFDCLRIVVTASSVTTGADVTTYLKTSHKGV